MMWTVWLGIVFTVAWPRVAPLATTGGLHRRRRQRNRPARTPERGEPGDCRRGDFRSIEGRHHRDHHHHSAEEGPAQRLDARPAAARATARPRCVGRAFTLRFVPAREDLATPESWSSPISTRAAIEAMPEGCIAVVDAMGITDAGIFGDILCARMAKRGVAALVTDGVGARPRRRARHRAAGVVRAARPRRPRSPALTFVGWQEPIGCGGVAVFPNDVIVADGDGAVLIPAAWPRTSPPPGRAGAAGGLDHARGRARRDAARPLSAERRDQGALRGGEEAVGWGNSAQR